MKKSPKLVFGVGINDVPGACKKSHPDYVLYEAWKNMLQRTYSAKYHQRFPTYEGCSVAPEWHRFSTFRDWCRLNGWAPGLHLDKDLLVKGNKMYSPDACTFVTQRVNTLLTDSAASRGEHPVGVNWHKRDKRFRARCNTGGKRVWLGLFTDPMEAHRAWQHAKFEVILDTIPDCSTAVGFALLDRVATLCADVVAGKETTSL